MKALIITRHYLDQNLGGPNCSKAFIRAISSIYDDCTLIYPEHNVPATSLSFITNKSLKINPCYDYRSRIKKCFDMYRGRIHRFGTFVETFLDSNKFDVIFIDHSFTASSGVLHAAITSGSKVVSIHHNVESEYIKDNQQSLLFRFPYNHFSLEAERNAIQKSDLNLTLTQSDMELFLQKYKARKESFAVAGVFEYGTTEVNRHDNCQYKENVFVISGALNAQQTEMSVIDFIEKYVPVLNTVCQKNKLIITGRNPSEAILAAAKRNNNISIVPNPNDILSVIGGAKYYICPLYTGGGLKLRIMDGLRLGLPVLAHHVSCRGYEAMIQDGVMFSYSDKETFVSGIKKLLSLNINRKQVCDIYNSYFSYNNGEERLKSILEEHHLL